MFVHCRRKLFTILVLASVIVSAYPSSIAQAAAPTLSSSTPVDGATGVLSTFDLTLTFDQAVLRGTGTIRLTTLAGINVESWDVATSTDISGFGTATITIDRTVTLAANTRHYFTIPSTAFKNSSNEFYAGVSGATGLDFTTLAPPSCSSVSISGTARTGNVLTASPTCTNSPTSYTYQWKRDGAAISGETASTYTVLFTDAGSTLTVGVTATNSAGTSSERVSAGTSTYLIVERFVGTGTVGTSNGTSRSDATLTDPRAVAVDNASNVYVCESGVAGAYRIRKIDTNGNVTNFVGSGTQGLTDGTGTLATINGCIDLRMGLDGYLYLMDGRYRRISLTGEVTTLQFANGTKIGSQSGSIQVDGSSNIYVGVGNGGTDSGFLIRYNTTTCNAGITGLCHSAVTRLGSISGAFNDIQIVGNRILAKDSFATYSFHRSDTLDPSGSSQTFSKFAESTQNSNAFSLAWDSSENMYWNDTFPLLRLKASDFTGCPASCNAKSAAALTLTSDFSALVSFSGSKYANDMIIDDAAGFAYISSSDIDAVFRVRLSDGDGTRFAVRYDANGATSGGVPTDPVMYSSGATVRVAANTESLARSGYRFAGWCTVQAAAGSTCAGAGGTSRSPTSTFSITSNNTLFAVWSLDSLTATLASSSLTSTSSSISFTVTGNIDVDCSTLSTTDGTDFDFTNISAISIAQTNSTTCTITATSTATAGGGSVTSTLAEATSFSMTDTAGNAQTSLGGSPQSITVTIADSTAPTLTFARNAATATSATIRFTVTGDEAITCSTLSTADGTDFDFTNISAISIAQTNSTTCTITATSTATAGGGTVTSTLTAATSFSMTDTAGNAQTSLGGSPQSIAVTIASSGGGGGGGGGSGGGPAPTTTSTSTTSTTTTTTSTSTTTLPTSTTTSTTIRTTSTTAAVTTTTIAVTTTTSAPAPTTTAAPIEQQVLVPDVPTPTTTIPFFEVEPGDVIEILPDTPEIVISAASISRLARNVGVTTGSVEARTVTIDRSEVSAWARALLDRLDDLRVDVIPDAAALEVRVVPPNGAEISLEFAIVAKGSGFPWRNLFFAFVLGAGAASWFFVVLRRRRRELSTEVGGIS